MAAARGAQVDALEQRVVDAALTLAAEVGWEQVRLSAIADRAGLALTEIGRHFRDVDAVANAWFARARLAMLALPAEELAAKPADERIALAFESWLDALASQRRVAAEILRHKLYPSHPGHHWVPLVFDLSRLVHDLLDVARVPGAQEIGLTAITTSRALAARRQPRAGTEQAPAPRAPARAGRLARWLRPEAEAAAPSAPEAAAGGADAAKTAPRRRRRGTPRTEA